MNLSLNNDYLQELKEWIRQTISEAEKKGDLHKGDQFVALRAELR